MLTKIIDGTIKIAVVGLGYVGLPLAVEFGKKFDVIGYDVQNERLKNLRNGVDSTGGTTAGELKSALYLRFSNDPEVLRDRDIFIVAVPTPVGKYDRPDLTPLYDASATIGKVMKQGAIVIYESTVYPGCTEEECIPLLERESGMKFNQDFFCGYSPERINPGDREHTLVKIPKITSGSTPETADIVDKLYNRILHSGTHRASSIRVAETAKLIENSQRDLNIAFVNEIAKICRLSGVDTKEVLTAAATKWNFLKFTPGLVGGNCIAAATNFLLYRAKKSGFLPELLLAGRHVNDDMGKYIAGELLQQMATNDIPAVNARILQLGITFKSNCNDIRNSKAAEIARHLTDRGCLVKILDPHAAPAEVRNLYGFDTLSDPAMLEGEVFDAIILTVAHREFSALDLTSLKTQKTVVYDVQGILPADEVDGRL